jgi:hypothetical protein
MWNIIIKQALTCRNSGAIIQCRHFVRRNTCSSFYSIFEFSASVLLDNFAHRIIIPACAIEQQWQSGVPKKFINVVNFQKWCFLNSKAVYYVALFQKLLTRLQIVHLFFALTVCIRWRLLFPTLCWSINTKSTFSPS